MRGFAGQRQDATFVQRPTSLPDQCARFVYGATIAFVLLGSLLWHYRGRLREAVVDLAFWVLLLLVLVGVYSYRFELGSIAARVVGELMPGATVEGKGGEVMVTRRLDGNFVLRMSANGVTLPFVFDTGASSVVLRAEDAERIGIGIEDLVFTHGDYCLPNVFLDLTGRRLTGFIDWGRAGIADRYQDLALAERSLRFNFGPGWERCLFDAYGLTHVDEAKLAYYRLLDEMF